MLPKEIKSKMQLLEKKQNAIAKKAKVSPAAVNKIINRKGKSRRLQALIAKEIGIDYVDVWGEGAA